MCSYKLGNRMFLIGSKTYPLETQKWELTSEGYKKHPNLPFTFDEGRCIGMYFFYFYNKYMYKYNVRL